MAPTRNKKKTYVIAEIGSCHDGDKDKMLRSVDTAADIGVSAIKFQWVSSGEKLARRRGKALDDGYAEIYERYIAWDPAIHQVLARRCARNAIDYMCTCYLGEDIRVVAPYVRRFKVSSFESRDIEFIKAHGEFELPVHVSFGMSTQEQALKVSSAVEDIGMDIRPMHCVSSYPAPTDSLNLSIFHNSCNPWDLNWDGFSDHSDPSETMSGALAVAAGAHTIEAHMRLDDTSTDNPDYQHAMDSILFSEYVARIRWAERALGHPYKDIQDCEMDMRRYKVKS
jgi:sialic acid synthase SpsE